jgi:hypothetical protein
VTDHQTSFFPAGRDRGVTVAVEGFSAFVWFGWGQAAPPSWLLIGVAAAALATGLASATAPSTVTGAGAGLCLLAFGLATLLTARRRPAAKIEVVPSLPRSARWLTVTSISTGRGKHE